MKLKPKRRRFDTIEEIQAESERLLDTERKGLPGSVQKMEETVGPGGNYFEGDGGRWALR
jgi:hypothetical protein